MSAKKSIEIQTLAFKKADLERLTTEERTAFLLFGHIANELAVLNKLHLWSSYSVQENGIRGRAGITQALVFARLLAGKLHEAWRTIEQAYFKSGVSRQYARELSPAGRESLKSCKKYFSRKNRLRETRNFFAFHYSISETRRGYARLDPDEDLSFYLAEERGNNLYYASEIAIGTVQGTLLGVDELKEGLEPFLREITTVGADLWNFLDQFIATVLLKHFGDPGAVLSVGKISKVPNVESIRVPYFAVPTRRRG